MDCCEAAAKWWRNKLENPMSLGNFKVTDNDDPMGGIFMAMAVQTMGNRGKDKPENYEKFEKELTETIRAMMLVATSVTLSVDYGADHILSRTALNSGIRNSVFPMKTTMIITKEKVSVSCGYHSRNEIIYPVEEEK